MSSLDTLCTQSHHPQTMAAYHNEEQPPLVATRASLCTATGPSSQKINKLTKKKKRKSSEVLSGEDQGKYTPIRMLCNNFVSHDVLLINGTMLSLS